MERSGASSTFPIGSSLPEFNLKNVDGKIVRSTDLKGAAGTLVVFTCNHCPYVKGSEQALNSLVRQYIPRGLRVVAINSNDASQYPEDSFDNMKQKAAALDLPYPYLHDETQAVARLFDAACTPECYLFDAQAKLVFHGTINDSPRDSAQATKNYLKQAIEQTLAGQKTDPTFVHPIGCSIKWKR